MNSCVSPGGTKPVSHTTIPLPSDSPLIGRAAQTRRLDCRCCKGFRCDTNNSDSATMRNKFEKTVLKNTFKKYEYARKMRKSNVSLTVRSAREVITSMGLRGEETASPRQRTIFLDHRDISIISTALPERTEARTLAPCFYLCKLVLAPLCFVVKQVCLQL